MAGLACATLLAAACGGDSDEQDQAAARPGTDIGIAYEAAGLPDAALGQEALLGLAEAEDDLGITIHSLETDDAGSDRAELLRVLAGDGAAVVVGVGRGFGPAVGEVAPDYAESTFVVVDGTGPDLPNVVSLDFADEQGAYLAGAAAALTSAKHRVAFVGVQGDERSTQAQAGFTVGALRIDGTVQVDVAHAPPGPDGGFDPETVRTTALALFAGGADLAYAAPGAASEALMAAAVEHGGVKVIGADRDLADLVDPGQAPLVLTSSRKAVAAVLVAAIRDALGQGLDPGVRHVGVAEDAVSLLTPGGLTPAASERVEELVADLVSGQIQVPKVP